MPDFVHHDGGREAAGFKGTAGDCVVRSVCIASGRDYRDVYDLFSAYCREQRVRHGHRRKVSARDGVNTDRKWFKDWMGRSGFVWTATSGIGIMPMAFEIDALPKGRLILSLRRHYTTLLDNTIFDIYDPRRYRDQVYGYWRLDRQPLPGHVDPALFRD